MSAENERQNRQAIAEVSVLIDGLFEGVVLAALESIKEGSPVTGSPGQPVDTGALRNSFMVEFDGRERATIGSNMEYAEAIEEGVGLHGPLTLRSAVGGFHSVAHTVAGMPRIVEDVTRRLTRGRRAQS